MKKTILMAVLAALVLIVPPLPNAAAQTPSAPVVVPPEVTQAEAYFATLKTAKARFVQTAPDGTQSRGNFYLSRPGKLRFEYDLPLKDFVVADGLMIYFYDGQLKQQSNAPISQTLADFLLRKNMSLHGDLKVKKIMRSGGLLQMTVIQTKEPGAGTLTLGFKESPKFELKKWRVVDAQGSITETELFNTQTGMNLPGSYFVYRDPQRKGLNQ
ncbi:MAG: outer membrane lipoprotein carrier protein LolA [Alphaproteobacteria bacterium]|nr:outer membrane lipoprotein carrier protein LolA [Alphaproteobacteria bacterium]